VSKVPLRTLQLGDEPVLQAFLAGHADSSMFLRSNARAAGLRDEGKLFQATYVAAFEGDRLTAVAAHCWNGMILVQAPAHLDAVVRAAAARSGRTAITGFSGPLAQVIQARATLGLSARPAKLDSREGLFALDLSELRVPAALASGEVACRRSADSELDLLAAWRADYLVELAHLERGHALLASARAEILGGHAAGDLFVLTAGGQPVAMTAFNAQLPEVVQVGGVWTPPALRRRGYARAVVAGSLLAKGAPRAILFTGDENHAAIEAYTSLGFARVGEYELVLFGDG
jgi:uncharacterized protein